MTLNLGINGVGLGGRPSNVPSWASGMDMYWDFTKPSGYPTSLVTDTHSSSIYADDSSGVYSSFGVNTLVRTNKGIQTVPTTQNFVTAPNDLSDESWTKDSCTATTNGAVGPFGTKTMDKICEISGTVTPFVRNYAFTTVTSGQRYVIYGYAKASERSLVAINFAGSGFPTYNRAFFDLSTGTITQVGADDKVSSGMTRLGNDIWLIWHSTLAGATAGGGFQLGMAKSSAAPSYAGTPGEGLYVEGFNMRLGSFPVPPIDSATTINGNQPVIDLTGKLATGVRGVIRLNRRALENNKFMLSFDDGSTANRIIICETSGVLRMFMTAGGVTSPDVTYDAAATGSQTYVFAVSSSYFKFRKVGGADSSASNPGTFPTGMTKAALGARSYAADANSFQNTMQLALGFGAQSSTTYDDAYAKAQILDSYV